MAKYLCYASEDELWATLLDSCERHDIPLQPLSKGTAILFCPQWKGIFQLTVTVTSDPSDKSTELVIQGRLNTRRQWIQRLVMIMGLGFLAAGFMSLNNNGTQSSVGILYPSRMKIRHECL